MNTLSLAELAGLLKLIADLSKSVEIDFSFVDYTLNDLLFIFEEILESHILVNITDALFVFLILVQVKHVVRNSVEWDVVNVQALGHVERCNVVFLITLKLMELVMPK